MELSSYYPTKDSLKMEMVESKWIGMEQLYTNLTPDGKDTALMQNKQTKEIIFETKEFSLNHDELSEELAGDPTKQQKWKQWYDDEKALHAENADKWESSFYSKFQTDESTIEATEILTIFSRLFDVARGVSSANHPVENQEKTAVRWAKTTKCQFNVDLVDILLKYGGSTHTINFCLKSPVILVILINQYIQSDVLEIVSMQHSDPEEFNRVIKFIQNKRNRKLLKEMFMPKLKFLPSRNLTVLLVLNPLVLWLGSDTNPLVLWCWTILWIVLMYRYLYKQF